MAVPFPAATTAKTEEGSTVAANEIDWYDDVLDSPHFPGFADKLRQLGVLDQLDYHDARQVVGAIICDSMYSGPPQDWNSGPRPPRDIALALQQRACNVGARCDNQRWVDRAAASRALGKAAAAVNDAGGSGCQQGSPSAE